MLHVYVHSNNVIIVPTGTDLNIIALQELQQTIYARFNDWKPTGAAMYWEEIRKIKPIIDATLFCIVRKRAPPFCSGCRKRLRAAAW